MDSSYAIADNIAIGMHQKQIMFWLYYHWHVHIQHCLAAKPNLNRNTYNIDS